MSEKYKKYIQNFSQMIIQQIKENKAIWQKPWEGGVIRQSHNPVTKTVYRGMNAFFLQLMQNVYNSDDTRWLTYKQAEKIGAQVKRGEKGTLCRYWNKYGYKYVRDMTGKIIKNEQGEKIKERYLLKSPFLKTFSVFHASQIDNIPPDDTTHTPHHWDSHKSAETLISKSGADICYHKYDSAFYSPQEDRIFTPQKDMFLCSENFYGTILHELAHWTGHKTRLNRDIYHAFGSADYAREELRAEIGAYMLSSQKGLPFNPGHHVSYAQAWVKILEDDPYEIVKATHDAHKICLFLEDITQDSANTEYSSELQIS